MPRATFGENTSTYDYDFNGNQTHRLVHSIVNGQPVTQEFEIEYDAENRVKNVTGVEGTTYSANFTYDGNGQRVKSTTNGETTLFVNGIYELNTTTNQSAKQGNLRSAPRRGRDPCQARILFERAVVQN